MSLLQINNLSVTFDGEDGPVQAVNNLSFSIDRGEVEHHAVSIVVITVPIVYE